MKDTFILKVSYQDVVNDLSDTQAGKLIKAIFEYVATGDIPAHLSDLEVKTALKFIKMDIDESSERYQNISVKRAEAGKKGGVAKQANANFIQQDVANVANATFAKQNKQTLTKQANATFAKLATNSDEVAAVKTSNSKENKQNKQMLNAKNVSDFDEVGAINNISNININNIDNIDNNKKEKEKINKKEKEKDLSAPVFTLPLNDGSKFTITENMHKQWNELYPAVDVMQELRNMCGWCIANPQKRKTASGVQKFINGWLARRQNTGGNVSSKNADTGYDSRAISAVGNKDAKYDEIIRQINNEEQNE